MTNVRFVIRLAFVAYLGAGPTLGCATKTRAVTSEDQACENVRRAAVEFHLSRKDLTGRYYCDPLPSQPTYYVLGLRYHTTADERVGSNLVGWYAVAKADGTVFNWDINKDRAEPLVPGPPFEAN